MDVANKDNQHDNNENWDDYSDSEQQGEQEKKGDKKKVSKEPKKAIEKDKYGNIIISKLDAYIEPIKGVKETRGDNRMHNNYNFGDLDISQGSDEEDEDDVIKSENEEESGEEDTNEKKAKPQTKKQAPEDLDNLLKEFGVEAPQQTTDTAPKEPKQKKPKKETDPANTEAKPETNENAGEKKESEEKKKKKKKKLAGEKTAKKSHVSEIRSELIARKEALLKKEKKKGL